MELSISTGLLGCQLRELLQRLLVEEVAVHFQFVGYRVDLDLHQRSTTSQVTTEVLLHYADDLEGVLVLANAAHKQIIRIAPHLLELLRSPIDLSNASLSPTDEVHASRYFGVNPITVVLGLLPCCSIHIHEVGELPND